MSTGPDEIDLTKRLLSRCSWQREPWSYVFSCLSVLAMTMIILVTQITSNIAIIPMLYLIGVTLYAFLFGSLPAVAASVLSFFIIDFFFTEPKFQLTVDDPAEWIALCMFLITSTLTGQLTALLRNRAEEAQRRKIETDALAEASWAIASELDRDKTMTKVVSQLAQVIEPQHISVLLSDSKMTFPSISEYSDPTRPVSEGFAAPSLDALKLVRTEGRSIGWDADEHWNKALSSQIYLPILLDNQVLGIVFVKLEQGRKLLRGKQQVVTSLLNHAAVILHRDNLMKAQAKAQALAEADKLKTALLSMISHDFRSPLTSIKASVSTILEEGEPVDAETQRALLQTVDQEADRLNKMVGNILDLSRLEAGAWRSHQESADVTELIGAVMDQFSKSDNARIDVCVDPKISELIVDSVQMVQVLKNLLENGLKYSPVVSNVELNVLIQDRNIIFEVSDRGGGLPKGDETQIFEPFYRGPSLNESAVPGVGIGLALCRGLVEANGGNLSALNREGGGAVFRVTLPSFVCQE